MSLVFRQVNGHSNYEQHPKPDKSHPNARWMTARRIFLRKNAFDIPPRGAEPPQGAMLRATDIDVKMIFL